MLYNKCLDSEKAMKEITQKLSDISEVMSDGYHFLNMRFLLEDIQERNDSSAKELINIVDKFHKLCKYITKPCSTSG